MDPLKVLAKLYISLFPRTSEDKRLQRGDIVYSSRYHFPSFPLLILESDDANFIAAKFHLTEDGRVLFMGDTEVFSKSHRFYNGFVAEIVVNALKYWLHHFDQHGVRLPGVVKVSPSEKQDTTSDNRSCEPSYLIEIVTTTHVISIEFLVEQEMRETYRRFRHDMKTKPFLEICGIHGENAENEDSGLVLINRDHIVSLEMIYS